MSLAINSLQPLHSGAKAPATACVALAPAPPLWQTLLALQLWLNQRQLALAVEEVSAQLQIQAVL
jgi:hypothetical protein